MGKSLQLKSLTIFLLLAMVMVLSGCATKATDPIIGTWQVDDMPGMTLTFTDQNSTLYTNGTTQMNWNGSTLYGMWVSRGNDSYSAIYAWSDAGYHNFQPIADVRIKYDHGILYTNIGGLSTFHRKSFGLQMPGSH